MRCCLDATPANSDDLGIEALQTTYELEWEVTSRVTSEYGRGISWARLSRVRLKLVVVSLLPTSITSSCSACIQQKIIVWC